MDVSLDGANNDGAIASANSVAEHDRVGESIEAVTGGSGDDTLTGSARRPATAVRATTPCGGWATWTP